MALIIEATNEKKIHLHNTAFELESVYARITFSGLPSGKKILWKVDFYQNKSFYQSGSKLKTDIPLEYNVPRHSGMIVSITDEELQDVNIAHTKAKAYFENLGFVVDIVDLPS